MRLGGLALVVLLSTAAFAAPNRQLAGEHFARGVALYEKNDFQAALSAFRAAYDAAPSFEVLWNIGLCEKQLRRYGDAVATLEAYLRQGGTRLPKDRPAAVADHLREVRALTAPLTVRTSGPPAEVLVDGERVGFTPLERFLLTPGTHVIRVEREGFAASQTQSTAVSGQPLSLSVELTPLEKPAAPPSDAPRAEVRPEQQSAAPLVAQAPATSRRAFPGISLLFFGLGAATLGGGIALTVEGQSVNDEITALYVSGGTWDDRWVQREGWGKTSRALGVVSIVTSVALVSVGVVIVAAELTRPTEQPRLTHLFIAPTHEGGVIALGGAF